MAETLEEYKSTVGNTDWLNGRMTMFDSRLYRNLVFFNDKMEDSIENFFYPHFDYGSYVTDFYETQESIENMIEETKNSVEDSEQKNKTIQALETRRDHIKSFVENKQKQYLAPRSFIHPYALVKLTGASGNAKALSNYLTYDQYNKRKFYEVDGEQEFSGNYSKTPTTTMLIKWGNESPRNKTPYSFQDFVFCKYWNKIENNRLITLRRYAAPVTDNIEFPDYNVSGESDNGAESTALESINEAGTKSTFKGSLSKNPWTPLATAVTYFGEDTGNKLSDILSFSARYRWKEIGFNENDPIDITSQQNDAGSGLINNSFGVTTGLELVAKAFGFFGEVNGNNVMNLDAAPQNLPPDPYKNGPYENRILGPVNVITNTYRRERGLEFKQDSLKLTFEYTARPIAGINSKAVLLDLMSNILLLTYSNGSWYGGMWRYTTDSPALYPWKFGDSMNKLYKGEIFGKNGFVLSLTKNIYKEGTSYLSTFLPDAAKFVTNLFKGAMNKIMGLFTGDKSKNEEAAANFSEVLATGTSRAIQKVIAAKALKGTTVPYLKNQRALLTGDPVGDWHLTIGNPLNPIATIGNLICKDVRFEFSDELGPDDFPIGFKAVIQLEHGLGRDREAIESMFNRGYGRIYTLSKEFRSSADGETKVDANTGGVNTEKGRTKYEETRNTYFGGGTRFIAKVQSNPLANRGKMYTGSTHQFDTLKPTSTMETSYQASTYYVNAWQMAMSL